MGPASSATCELSPHVTLDVGAAENWLIAMLATILIMILADIREGATVTVTRIEHRVGFPRIFYVAGALSIRASHNIAYIIYT